jgi:Uri superfamily endonuclease
MKGTYLLLISLPQEANINVGALGTIHFYAGFYIYVGSAMGSIGSTTLLNRVKRHVKNHEEKSIHWHIDYFLRSRYSILIRLYLIPSGIKLECVISNELLITADDSILNFGCSDCRCKSHLFYYKTEPNLSQIMDEKC